MWIFTPIGFYSAVQKPEDVAEQMLTVRSRAKEDLDNLAVQFAELELDPPEPYQNAGTDYPWRVRVPQQEFALFVASVTLGINYRNFKDEVKHVQSAKRASVYGKVWSAMLDADPDHKPYSSWSTTGSAYAPVKTDWRKGDRAFDRFKKKACTIEKGGKKPTVRYDGDPEGKTTVITVAADLTLFWEVGSRAYDWYAKKTGTIKRMKPLELLYDDGSKSATTVLMTDLRDPSTAPKQLPSGSGGGSGKLFDDQRESQKQRGGKKRNGGGGLPKSRARRN